MTLEEQLGVAWSRLQFLYCCPKLAAVAEDCRIVRVAKRPTACILSLEMKLEVVGLGISEFSSEAGRRVLLDCWGHVKP